MLILNPIYGKLRQEGDLKGKVNINLRDLTYQGEIQVKTINLGNFAAMFLPSSLGRIGGEGEIEANFKGKEFTLLSLEKYLNAQAKVSIKDGAIVGNPMLKEIATFLDIPKLAQFQFHRLNGSLRIIDGNVRINTTANQKEYGISI